MLQAVPKIPGPERMKTHLSHSHDAVTPHAHGRGHGADGGLNLLGLLRVKLLRALAGMDARGVWCGSVVPRTIYLLRSRSMRRIL